MIHAWVQTWFHWVEQWGYLGVFVLMALESSIVPVPSEIVMPPAAFWAAQGKLNFWGVVLAGTTGSLAGSAASYGLAQVLGTPFLKRYGKWFLLSPAKLDQAELWLKRHGWVGIFTSRLLPVLRHLISIPAGIFRMPFLKFCAVTTVGAGLWCTILAWFGAEVIGAQPDLLSSPEAMIAAIKAKLQWFVIAVVLLAALYFVFVRRKSPSFSSSTSK